MSALERFWDKIMPEPNCGCWYWLAGTSGDGYGSINVRGKMIRAHRFSYQIFNGDITADICVLHRCDEPLCVNPDHLFLGAHQDNVSDMVGKNRQAKGESQHLAKLTENQVKEIRKLRNSGWKLADIANLFDVTYANISAIVLRKSWRHIP